MNFVEYMFNEASKVWVPVQVSGWQTYSQEAQWELYPEGGMRFLQAWASDAHGNISKYPYFQYINYIKPCDPVSRDGRRIYRQHLEVGERLYAAVAPCSGDPDLYVWPPDWEEGDPPWVSNVGGSATDQVYITATVKGNYQIEVYGYTAAWYDINIEVEQGGITAQSQYNGMMQTEISETGPYFFTAGIMGVKPWPQSPAVPPDSTPGTEIIPVSPAPFREGGTQIYLPLVLRNS